MIAAKKIPKYNVAVAARSHVTRLMRRLWETKLRIPDLYVWKANKRLVRQPILRSLTKEVKISSL